ncbi:MAG: hypothetical protein ACN4GT_02655 [Gammaproteobacteria bacterium]
MTRLKIVLGALLLSVVMPLQAATVAYILGDHEDASLYNGGSGDPYGLRFDDFDPPSGNGPTFSVGDNLGGLGGLTTLSWDDANLAAGAVIAGTIWNNDANNAWTVTYNLTGVASDGNGGITATGGSGSATDGSNTIILIGKQDATSGKAFIFAADGHRLAGDTTSWVGRGWLEGGGTDDWIVTAVPVPVPAAAWLFGSALGLLAWSRRRRS